MPPQPPPPTPLSPYLSTVLNSASAPHQTITGTQRTLQALNKPYHAAPTSPPNPSTESYELRQKRDQAASVLENVEMLLWYSSVRNESISQTRAHFMNIVLGANMEGPNDQVWREEWEVPGVERVRGGDAEMGGTSAKGSPRGKERRKRTSDFRG